ncbi:response regulator transcription factor [Aquimarina rhabdastrellae]
MITPTTLKVMIADDHLIVIDGIRSLLKHNTNIQIVGEATNGKDALQVIQEKEVDIAILDINMPMLNGVEVTQKINELKLDTKVLFLTMEDTPEFITQSIDIGAAGYIVKNRGKEELETALERIAQGEKYFGPEAKDVIFNRYVQKKKNEQEVRLTRREIEVLKLIADGHSTRQISEKLFIAHATVETHRRNLIDKTGVSNGTKGLIKYAIKKGYSS